MWSSPCPEGARPRGFTLLEVMIALLVLTVLMSALAIPVAAQIHGRRMEETRRTLDEAREALLGFAAGNGRLPCPATDSSAGQESFVPGGDAAGGQCAQFYGGYLPAATLGLSPLDAQGYSRDAWGTPDNRIRYSVFGGAVVNGVPNPFTRANGLQLATLAALADAPRFISICASGAGATGAGCGAASNHLTRKAVFVLLSPGPNAVLPPAPGGDEALNLAGTGVFVAREASTVEGREFDDVLHWGSVHLVVNRLLAAGRLP